MIDISANGRDFQEELLNLIRASQETVVDALQAWTSAVQAVIPSFLKADLPYADQLPGAGTLVSGVYDFAEQLLAMQRNFAIDVFRTAAPLTGQGAAA